jgi:hypothetical protein
VLFAWAPRSEKIKKIAQQLLQRAASPRQQADNAGIQERLRDLVDRVDIGPGADRDHPEIILTGALAAMLKLTMPESTAFAVSGHDLFLSSVKVVAGARFERAAFRL